MQIEQIIDTEIFMEGDSTITVETLVLVEAVTLAADPNEYTPAFAAVLQAQGGAQC